MRVDNSAASAADVQSVCEDATTSDSNKTGSPKAKSAPGSMSGEKKWITSKGNTLKEIESWATDGHENDAPDYARQSGQLMDNVTEQRMLTAKLWELSKERHKFLTSNAYEKKIFLDRQQRKSGAMREMLDGVAPDGRRTGWADEALRRRANVEDETGTSSARSVFLDRMDPKKRRDRPKDWESRHSSCPTPSESGRRTMLSLPQVAPSIVTSQDGYVKNPRMKAAVSATLFPTEPRMLSASTPKTDNSKRPKSSYDRMVSTQLQPADHPPTTVRFADSKPDFDLIVAEEDEEKPVPSRSWSTAKWNRQTTGMSSQSRMTERRGGSGKSGPSADPRYLQLKQALADNYYNRDRPGSISRIITSVEALHKPSKRSKDAQPRVTHRIREFMRERGFQF